MHAEIIQAFALFLKSTDLEDAIIASTKASWGGGHYAVELLPDCTYRVLSSNEIGNLYQSPGAMLKILALTEDEWDENEEEHFFENAREQLMDNFDCLVEEMQ